MITNQLSIKIIPFRKITAIKVAELCYAKWMGDVSFSDDVAAYLTHGVVVVRPDIFWMGCVVDARPMDADGNPIGDRPEPAWFIRMCVGDLRDLMRTLPEPHFPKMYFCRRNDGRMREYSLEKLKNKIEGIEGGKHGRRRR